VNKYPMMVMLGLLLAGPVQRCMAQYPYYPYAPTPMYAAPPPMYGQPMYGPPMGYPPMPQPYMGAPGYDPYAGQMGFAPGMPMMPQQFNPGGPGFNPQGGGMPALTRPASDHDPAGYNLLQDIAGQGPGFVPRTRGYTTLPMPRFDPNRPLPKIDPSGYDFSANDPKYGPCFVPRNPAFPILPEPRDSGPEHERRFSAMNARQGSMAGGNDQPPPTLQPVYPPPPPRDRGKELPESVARPLPDAIGPPPGPGNGSSSVLPGFDGSLGGNTGRGPGGEGLAEVQPAPMPQDRPSGFATMGSGDVTSPPPLYDPAKGSSAAIPDSGLPRVPDKELVPMLPSASGTPYQAPRYPKGGILQGLLHPHDDPTCSLDPNGWAPVPTPRFPCDAITFQVMGGLYHNTTNSTTYNYAPIDFRWGRLFGTCLDNCWLRGAFEPIFELNAAPTADVGHLFVGTSFLLRYNFVQPECRLVPYVQVGAGLQYNDGYRDLNQNALGQAMEYVGSAQVGLRYFLKPNLSLDFEGGYMVVNNLDQAPRNEGIHAIGGSIGLTYYFPLARHY
jgi:hypothetical protein